MPSARPQGVCPHIFAYCRSSIQFTKILYHKTGSHAATTELSHPPWRTRLRMLSFPLKTPPPGEPVGLAGVRDALGPLCVHTHFSGMKKRPPRGPRPAAPGTGLHPALQTPDSLGAGTLGSDGVSPFEHHILDRVAVAEETKRVRTHRAKKGSTMSYRAPSLSTRSLAIRLLSALNITAGWDILNFLSVASRKGVSSEAVSERAARACL